MATAYANYSVLHPISAAYGVRFLITELLDERTVNSPFPSLLSNLYYRYLQQHSTWRLRKPYICGPQKRLDRERSQALPRMIKVFLAIQSLNFRNPL